MPRYMTFDKNLLSNILCVQPIHSDVVALKCTCTLLRMNPHCSFWSPVFELSVSKTLRNMESRTSVML